jgi:hypothetical protein
MTLNFDSSKKTRKRRIGIIATDLVKLALLASMLKEEEPIIDSESKFPKSSS